MKSIATTLILIAFVLLIYIGFFVDSDALYFIGDQCSEVCAFSACAIMAYCLKWHTLFIIITTIGVLSFCELIDEVNGRNATIFANDYILLTIGIITALYLTISQWQKSKTTS